MQIAPQMRILVAARGRGPHVPRPDDHGRRSDDDSRGDRGAARPESARVVLHAVRGLAVDPTERHPVRCRLPRFALVAPPCRPHRAAARALTTQKPWAAAHARAAGLDRYQSDRGPAARARPVGLPPGPAHAAVDLPRDAAATRGVARGGVVPTCARGLPVGDLFRHDRRREVPPRWVEHAPRRAHRPPVPAAVARRSCGVSPRTRSGSPVPPRSPAKKSTSIAWPFTNANPVGTSCRRPPAKPRSSDASSAAFSCFWGFFPDTQPGRLLGARARAPMQACRKDTEHSRSGNRKSCAWSRSTRRSPTGFETRKTRTISPDAAFQTRTVLSSPNPNNSWPSARHCVLANHTCAGVRTECRASPHHSLSPAPPASGHRRPRGRGPRRRRSSGRSPMTVETSSILTMPVFPPSHGSECRRARALPRCSRTRVRSARSMRPCSTPTRERCRLRWRPARGVGVNYHCRAGLIVAAHWTRFEIVCGQNGSFARPNRFSQGDNCINERAKPRRPELNLSEGRTPEDVWCTRRQPAAPPSRQNPRAPQLQQEKGARRHPLPRGRML